MQALSRAVRAGARATHLHAFTAGRSFHCASALLADFVVIVPNMSESISEGIVSNLPKPIGSPVAVDDIVVELETDKVTFQVRSTQAGVVKSIAVNNGDTVPVGAPLLTLDTDGKAAPAAAPSTSAASPQPPAAAPSTAAAAPAPAASASTAHASAAGGRVPSIKFKYGKREPTPAAAASPPKKAAAAASGAAPAFAGGDFNAFLDRLAPSKAGGKTYLDLPAAFGRPAISAKEMAAIESGGAY